MQDVDIWFKLVKELENPAKYMQEKPALSELRILSDLYLGYQAIEEVTGSPLPPERLRVTLHFEDATAKRPTTERTISIVVKLDKEVENSIRYSQETPDPKVLNVIPSPYISKEILEKAVGKGKWPERLGITVHF